MSFSRIILIPGWGGGEHSFLSLRKQLQKEVGSSLILEEYNWKALIQNEKHLVRALVSYHQKKEKLLIVAHSLGGLCLLKALSNPEVPKLDANITLVATTARLLEDENYPGVSALALSSLGNLLSVDREGAIRRFIVQSGGKISWVRRFLAKDFSSHHLLDLASGLSFLKNQDLRDLIPEVRDKALFSVVHGSNDQVIPPVQGLYLAKELESPFYLVEEGTHSLHAEKSQVLLDYWKSWGWL